MSKEIEYRRYAAALAELATRAASAADKFRLLVMAEAWLKLANKIGLMTKQRSSGSTVSQTDSDAPHWQ
jgi:hypothetical protein